MNRIVPVSMYRLFATEVQENRPYHVLMVLESEDEASVLNMAERIKNSLSDAVFTDFPIGQIPIAKAVRAQYLQSIRERRVESVFQHVIGLQSLVANEAEASLYRRITDSVIEVVLNNQLVDCGGAGMDPGQLEERALSFVRQVED